MNKLTAYITADRIHRYSHIAVVIYCLTAALSIALSQILVLFCILCWIVKLFVEKATVEPNESNEELSRFTVPLILWLLASLISTLVGIELSRSLPELLKTSIYLLFPYALYSLLTIEGTSLEKSLNRVKTYILCLSFGFCLSSIHTVLSEAVGFQIPPRTPGPVTESGQLVFVLSIVFSICLYYFPKIESPKRTILTILLAFVCGIVIAWPQLFFGMGSSNIQAVAGIILLALTVTSCFRFSNKIRNSSLGGHIQSAYIEALASGGALIFAAFILNLKRGPWFGIFIVLILLGILLARKIALASCLIFIVLLFFAEPARERIMAVNDHLFIEGGRVSMWVLGAELAARFPLGLGPDNAVYMQELDPSLPTLHRHMHNNFLNIAVETGWIGLTAFIWWIITILRMSLEAWRSKTKVLSSEVHNHARIMCLALGLAILGWQISGLVEYNFGDGEVRLLAFFCMGLLLALKRLLRSSSDEITTSALGNAEN